MSKSTLLALSLLLGAGGVLFWKSSQNLDTAQKSPSAESALSEDAPTAALAPSSWENLVDDSVRWQIRVDRLRRLNKDALSEPDVETLYNLLDRRPSALHAEAWWVVVNEIMEQLRKQGVAPQRYTPALLTIIKDQTAPDVLRDYAIQHLSQWLTPRGADLGNFHEENPELIKEAAQAFTDLILDAGLAHTSIPGTTLSVLADMKTSGLSEETLAEVTDQLHPWLQSTLTEEVNSEKNTRISAINAIGVLQLKQHLPAIRELASPVQTSASVRLSSIATLGQLGEETDLPFLEKLAASQGKFRFAAQTARKNLSQQLTR